MVTYPDLPDITRTIQRDAVNSKETPLPSYTQSTSINTSSNKVTFNLLHHPLADVSTTREMNTSIERTADSSSMTLVNELLQENSRLSEEVERLKRELSMKVSNK